MHSPIFIQRCDLSCPEMRFINCNYQKQPNQWKNHNRKKRQISLKKERHEVLQLSGAHLKTFIGTAYFETSLKKVPRGTYILGEPNKRNVQKFLLSLSFNYLTTKVSQLLQTLLSNIQVGNFSSNRKNFHVPCNFCTFRFFGSPISTSFKTHQERKAKGRKETGRNVMQSRLQMRVILCNIFQYFKSFRK